MRHRVLRASAALVLLAAYLSSASAVEIPDGIESNLTRGDFGKNTAVALKMAIVDSWLENKPGEDVPVVGVDLDFKRPDLREKISIAFMVTDAKFDKQFTGALGGAVRESGMVALSWNRLDAGGMPLPDGIYSVVMNITGDTHGDLLKNAVFPLYLVSGAPGVGGRTQSTETAVLEYGGAPELGFTSTGIGMAAVVDYDAEGNEIGRWESAMGPGKHTLQSDLTDKEDNLLAPGHYATHVMLANNLGESDVLEYEYEVVEPPALELSVALASGQTVRVDDDTEIPMTVTVNQNVRLTMEYVAEGGKSNFIGKSTPGRPAVLYNKGEHEVVWHLSDLVDMTRYTSGKFKFRATATTLTGEKKAAESKTVTLTPAPKPPPSKTPPQQQQTKKEPERTVPKVSLSLDPDHILIGGRMVVKVGYRFDQDSMIKVTVFDKNNRVVKRLVDSKNEHIKKGGYSVSLDAENFDYGNYKIVFEATNFYGTRTAAEHLSVTWR